MEEREREEQWGGRREDGGAGRARREGRTEERRGMTGSIGGQEILGIR